MRSLLLGADGSLLPCMMVALLACSPTATGPTPTGTDAGTPRTGDEASGSDSTDRNGSDRDSDTGSETGSHTGSDRESDTGSGDGDTDGDTGGDTQPPPGTITAHLMETCDSTNFAGFSIDIGMAESTCDDYWTVDDRLQLIVGEDDLLPPSGGRTYTVVEETAGIYPDDGQVKAEFFGANRAYGLGLSGELVVESSGAGQYTGTYDMMFDDGMRREGTFTSDECIPACD